MHLDPQEPEALTTLLQQLEQDLLRREVRRDPVLLSSLLADDFREFGSSGRIFTKAETLAELAAESPRQISLTDFRCILLAPGLALLTYRSLRHAPPSAPAAALRSSLWRERDGRWQMLFHQGTPLPASDPAQA